MNKCSMTSSQKQQRSGPPARPDVEWQTPAVSEKFHGRLGRRPGTVDSGDPGLAAAVASDNAEDFCSSSSGSPSFQPIRSQIPIPTAHVMPSTAGALAPKHQQSHRTSGSKTSSSSSAKSSLSKSASSPNLDAQGTELDSAGPRSDCLSRYRSLVNGLDHSLFPTSDHTRLDEGHTFNIPAMEPTLNQSALLGSLGPDVRQRLQMTGLVDAAECRSALEQTFKVLPQAAAIQRTALGPCPPEAGAKAHVPERCLDAGSWQQLESLRLQVEQMQLMASGAGQFSLYPSGLHAEGSKWDAVVQANENLLREKEIVIERQKQQVSQLEQRLRESELQVHGALLGRGAPYTDVCLLRLQEAQRENAFLRAQFAERSDCMAKEKLDAERRLGAVEVETHRLSETLKESSEKHAEELKKQEERIRNRDKHINQLKKKCQKESEQNREKQQRIETLERYLADLPTMDDYQAQTKQVEEAERRIAELQATVRELEARLGESRAAMQDRDMQLEEQRCKERDLLCTVTSLQERVREGLEDGARLPSLDLEKLRVENAALKEEQQRLKRVIEKQLRMMEQLGSQIKVLEQQLSQEESCSQALREELSGKDQGLLQLRTAMKELSTQNQELLEQNLTLQEHMRDLEQSTQGNTGHGSSVPAGSARLTQRLHVEMASCLGDLRSLCNILTQLSQGRDPNLSLLLGITPPSPLVDSNEDWLSSEVLQKKLVEVQQLRHDLEEVRTTVSDRYAQDMGENCTTQ
ncbi:centrosomal protein of 85 kDa isoform X2 [Denticeps clupeoides]|uniref:centrosomal protein of 85 kDa isoform X2 n=1 Tax=Denticeps clupeoides TaxID=299321 RepID=UPI0010A4CF0E|nr:centrosomal protein of 85 kDa isoform X2 [Denticeps clupeoides]XP_028834976.1 centrosomal protein of 85 kDa isoform X2 [Denticeps clupeoides]